MRRIVALVFCFFLLAACASAPAPSASARVRFDACGQPVVSTEVVGVPAGGGWVADTTTTVYRPCDLQEAHDAAPPADR